VKVHAGRRVAFDCAAAETHWQKFRGIMLRKKFKPLLFDFGREATRPNAIHSLFCPPFWAVWMDERKRVIEVRRVKPWLGWIEPRKPARYLIETADRRGVRAGETLRW